MHEEKKESRRPAFEQAVIDRMKEGGFLEVEIRVECLARSGDGYYDGSVDAYWHFWNAALDGVVIELPHPVPSICKAGKGRGDEVTFHLLNKEGDPIGGEPAGGYANDNARLRAELAALKAQDTVGEVVGWYRLDRPYEMTPYPSVCATWHRLGAPVAPLYAAHAQQVIVPDGWKLVPVEPTPEMVCAAEEAHMPFGDMDIALRMAILSAPSAPATVQGVNQQLLEALEELMYAHTDKAEALATAAIAAARKGEGK